MFFLKLAIKIEEEGHLVVQVKQYFSPFSYLGCGAGIIFPLLVTRNTDSSFGCVNTPHVNWKTSKFFFSICSLIKNAADDFSRLS
jgi:hypothetical protein